MINMINFSKKHYLAIAISCALISGCSNTDEMEEIDEIKDMHAQLQEMVGKQFELSNTHYRESDDIYVLGQAFETKEEQPLPPIFDVELDFAQFDKIPLDEVLSKINQYYQQYGIIISVESDADFHLRNVESKGSSSSSSTLNLAQDSTATSILPIQQLNTTALSSSSHEGFYPHKLTLNFTHSSLRQMMDLITASTGLWWKYENGRITLNYFIEDTFPLDVSNYSYEITSTQNSNTESDNATSGFNINTASEKAEPLTQLEEQLKKYLSRSGSLALNKFDRTVTVKDTPNNVRRVERFIDDLNYTALTPYSIQADVYEIIWEVNDEKQVSWTAAFESASFALNALSPTVISDSGLGSITATKIGGDFDGSNIIGKFLNENASVYSRITNTIKTKNNIPTQLISSQDRAIVSGREVTIDSNGFSQQSVNTKLINEGFNITTRPRLTSDGKVDMEVIVNTKSIGDIKTFGSEEDMVQLEETKQHGTISGIPIRSGETVVLNAYERDLNRADLASLAKSLPWWTGGGKSNKRYKSSLIVMVKPVIMER